MYGIEHWSSLSSFHLFPFYLSSVCKWFNRKFAANQIKYGALQGSCLPVCIIWSIRYVLSINKNETCFWIIFTGALVDPQKKVTHSNPLVLCSCLPYGKILSLTISNHSEIVLITIWVVSFPKSRLSIFLILIAIKEIKIKKKALSGDRIESPPPSSFGSCGCL